MYNILYRLGNVYNTTYYIDQATKEFFENWDEESPEGSDDKKIPEYVQESKLIGGLIGSQFKNLFSADK